MSDREFGGEFYVISSFLLSWVVLASLRLLVFLLEGVDFPQKDPHLLHGKVSRLSSLHVTLISSIVFISCTEFNNRDAIQR